MIDLQGNDDVHGLSHAILWVEDESLALELSLNI